MICMSKAIHCYTFKKLKFENYKNCLEETQLQNSINHLERIKLIYIVLKKIMNNS